MFPSEFTLSLVRHPATPAPVVRSLEAHAAYAADGSLEIAYCLRGDMVRLLIPEPQPPGCADGLWEHTCFEVFVGVAGEPGYHEFNFSPSGKWAAYAFGNYRQLEETRSLSVPPQIKARLSAGRLEVEARIVSSVLPRSPMRRDCRSVFAPSSKPSTRLMAATVTGRCTTPLPCPIFTIVTVSHWNWRRRTDLPEGLADARTAVRTRPPANRRRVAEASEWPPHRPGRPPGIGQRRSEHALDALAALPDLRITAAFGPQHGLRGDKQDNMVESPDFLDPVHGIPVFSLYGEVRRPTPAMMASFDVLLIDLQDLGCRIYTFITTLRYLLEAAAEHGKAVWILDRPNPVGRPVEGLLLRPAGRASSAPERCRCATA
jgi:hypothetical protein